MGQDTILPIQVPGKAVPGEAVPGEEVPGEVGSEDFHPAVSLRAHVCEVEAVVAAQDAPINK